MLNQRSLKNEMMTCFKCHKIIPGKYITGEVVMCKECIEKWKTGDDMMPMKRTVCPECNAVYVDDKKDIRFKCKRCGYIFPFEKELHKALEDALPSRKTIKNNCNLKDNDLRDKMIDANDIARFPTVSDWISVKDEPQKEDTDATKR